ncbi:MAG: polyprenyl synthetase family protein [Candidatus Omnitrophica bacterium]|nr:polyprenyl synthetase family protein [Candidatus Omnitrophota bacterium]
MLSKLKNSINQELVKFTSYINKRYKLFDTSPLLFNSMMHFILAKGKRVRPILFVIGYKGFTARKPKNLYRSALAIELLHAFLLVHDDIVDNSDMRRGRVSMHKLMGSKIKRSKKATFSGKDLAMITGDIMYAIAIEAFLSIHEDPIRKEEALKKFIETACYTGCGEFIELIYSIEDISKIKKDQIYKIYDYKTAYYTFIAPLVTGAVLAGAPKKQIGLLIKFGTSVGRAFQIKDDILGMFEQEKKTGKSGLSDLQEGKKTILIWYAYTQSGKQQKNQLKKILNKNKVTRKDLDIARKIIIDTGSLEYAKTQIKISLKRSSSIIENLQIGQSYKKALIDYNHTLLDL